ncbi:MAG TPA: PEP-CTERM sorting domain-containing protein [Bryobacteraceae bacterium]|nr:PEP-CTERM sorting domain-containing protein [Bryobacteraceae bacterium]
MKILFWIGALMLSVGADATTVYIAGDAMDTTNNSGDPTINLMGGANMRVMADDTASVALNGHTLIDANLNQGPVCAEGQIGCLRLTEEGFTLAALAPYLVDGTNTLWVGVAQMNGSPFGLNFNGVVLPNADPTPEPATLALFAGGLFSLLMLRRRPK